MYVSEQLSLVQPFIDAGYKTLSLDPLFIGDYNIEISRCYNIQGQYLEHCLRPESKYTDITTMFLEQLLAIPKDTKLVIVEDDCITGNSVTDITSLLRKRLDIEPELLIFKDVRGLKDKEILDLRDFIVGSPFGGLVIESFGTTFEQVKRRWSYVFLTDDHLSKRVGLPTSVIKNFRDDMYKISGRVRTDSLLPF
jgi:hypothetical protein